VEWRPQRGPSGRALNDSIVYTLRAAGCVFAEDEASLLIEAAGPSPQGLAALVARRVAGEPLEHVVGWVDFCGLRVAVDPGVFVPRQRTAFLARQAAARAFAGAVVVDLCCGSGAVAAAVLSLAPGVHVHAVDVEPAAVRCARRNLPYGRVHEGDLFEPLPPDLRGRVDVLVANAPYVPSAEVGLMPPEARLHEPLAALDGGADGLDVLRRVIAAAPAWLAPGGSVLVETGDRQAPALAADVVAAGLRADVVTGADADATVVVGTLTPAVPAAGR
jgi:release factor glutamine methyltransferase